MSLLTHSRFYFGHTVDKTNNAIDFKEGAGPELQATIRTGEYTLTEFAEAVELALNSAGALDYTVTLNRTTRKLTITTTSTFSLLVATGSRTGTGAWDLMGFTGADRTGASTYTGDSPSGFEYTTQFILQDHIPSDNYLQSVESTVNKSASGKVEVFKYGVERFVQMNFKFITNKSQTEGSPIRDNPTGVADFLILLNYLITKAPIEYMPDEDTVSTFQNLLLESTPDESKGVGYKLRELYDRGLPGFFESGILKMRVIT